MGDIIKDIKKFQKGWVGGKPETPCGAGSTLANTKAQRDWIPKIIKTYKIKTIADIGAGDLNWISRIKFPRTVKYTAYDLIIRKPDVVGFNLLEEIPPKVDLIMCLWVLNHFPFEQCRIAIENIKRSESKYLLMTHRPIWLKEQPPEIDMEYQERLILNGKQDQIRLIKL